MGRSLAWKRRTRRQSHQRFSIGQVGEAVTILPTVTGLLLVTCHLIHHVDLVVYDLLDVFLVVIKVLPVMRQPNVLTIELLLDDVVPLLQTLYQCLVVGYKELDVLPILARLLFETVALKMHSLS